MTEKEFFLDALKIRVLLFDGAMGTEIQKYDPTPEDFPNNQDGFNDGLILTHPDWIKQIHRNYLDAGADCIETNSFGSNKIKLDEYGFGDQTVDFNKKIALLASEVCAEYSDTPRFVIGSMGPTGYLPSSDDPDLGQMPLDEIREAFELQAEGLILGGVDALLIETSQDIEPGTTKLVILKNKFLFLSLLLRHIGAAAVWTILPIMIVEKWGGDLYHISVVYVANTLTAFILMNIMASKIQLSNITKFKIGIGCTTFVFIGLSFVTEWWMAMPFMSLVGATWAFLFIGGNFHLMENNPRSTSTGIFSSTLSIATVIGPLIAGSIAFMFDYIAVMYFAIVIIVCAFIVSLKIKK